MRDKPGCYRVMRPGLPNVETEPGDALTLRLDAFFAKWDVETAEARAVFGGIAIKAIDVIS